MTPDDATPQSVEIIRERVVWMGIDDDPRAERDFGLELARPPTRVAGEDTDSFDVRRRCGRKVEQAEARKTALGRRKAGGLRPGPRESERDE